MPSQPAYEASAGLGRISGFDDWVGKIFVGAVQRQMSKLPDENIHINLPIGGPYQFPNAQVGHFETRFRKGTGVRIDYEEIDTSNPSLIRGFWLVSHNDEAYVEASHSTLAREAGFTIDTETHGYNPKNPRANKIPTGFAFNTLRMLRKAVKFIENSPSDQEG